jgi:hypothetical protein
MSVRIEQTAERAHRLVATGEVAAAQAMLREALATVEPDPAHASPSLATAAMLYARVLVTLGEPGTARRWAAYAHTASRRLFGAGDERTLQAASVLAGVLYRAGAYSRSAYIYRDLINQLSAGDGPRSARVLAAQADLATVLHARGDCARARDLLDKTWRIYRYRYGEDHPVGIRMLARLGGMERNCGLPERARERFALAEALCRWHLPPGHRLTAQIEIISRTLPDRRHICTEPHSWAGDGAELSPPPIQRQEPERVEDGTPDRNAAAYRGAIPEREAAPEAEAAPQRVSSAASPGAAADGSTVTDVAPRPVPPVPATLREADQLNRRARRRQQVKLGVMAGMAVMIVTVITIAAGVLIARARSTSDDRPGTPGTAAPGTAAPGNAAPGTAAPGTAAPGDAASGNAASGNAASGNATPSAPSAGQPAASRTAGPPASPAAPPAAQAPGPPTGVTLTDGASSLTLTWVYPAGAGGQVMLSAGRPGQPRRTFQTLPAGTSRFTVYGLAQDTNYCFGVGVVYSPTVVKSAPPVCTAR